MLLSLSLLKEDIALRFCRRDLGMLVYNFLNWYLTLRSFHYSLYVRCILSWRRALGPLGGLSTGQLNCCLPRMEEKRRETRNFFEEFFFKQIFSRRIAGDTTLGLGS